MNEAAEVLLWGTRIGFLSHSGDAPFAEFSYDRDFIGNDFLSKSNYFDTI